MEHIEPDTYQRYIKAITDISRAITSDLYLEDILKLIVLVTAKEPNNALYGALKGKVPEVHLIGDCDHATNAVMGISYAIEAGHLLGRQL